MCDIVRIMKTKKLQTILFLLHCYQKISMQNYAFKFVGACQPPPHYTHHRQQKKVQETLATWKVNIAMNIQV